MHICGNCHNACACGGDTGLAVSAEPRASCTCCPGQCAHGVEFGFQCNECDIACFGRTPEEDACAEAPAQISLNGGW